MSGFGHYALFASHALALWGAAAALVAFGSRDERFLKSAVRSIYAITVLVFLAAGALVTALIRDDFTIKYVWEYSRRSQPFIYKVSALWGGMSGSLLFWALLLGIFSTLAVSLNRKNNRKILPFTAFILLLTLGFFLFVLTFKANPFEALADSAGNVLRDASMVDGNGLNPLLQNIYMAIHPPTLYFGYVGYTIPFAFILAALAHGERNTIWMRSARNWAVFCWLTLGLGNILGAYWAYIELGWGGYWAWDPVENASFMPWLTGTAFLHSFLMQEKRGVFRFWNAFFVVVTFLLCIYGTYLTRSGILQSVHAFGQEDSSLPWYFQMGNIFLGFMALMAVISVAVVWLRRAMLKSKYSLESAGSRESMFLYGNLLFTLITFVVFFGVTSPIFRRMLTGQEPHLGPEFYNAWVLPMALFLLLVMGISSLAPWRKGRLGDYGRKLALPVVAGFTGVLVSILAIFVKGEYALGDLAARPKVNLYLILCVGFSFFVLTIIVQEYLLLVRHVRSNRGHGFLRSLAEPFRLNPRRYGGYLVHVGMVFLFLGVAFSSAYQTQYQETMKKGDEVRFGPYTVRMAALGHDDLRTDLKTVNEMRIWADLEVFRGDRPVSRLTPMRVYYAANPEQPMYEVAIHSTLMMDFYTLLSGFDVAAGTAVVGVFVNPMVAWLWLGGLFVMIGGLVAVLPMRRT